MDLRLTLGPLLALMALGCGDEPAPAPEVQSSTSTSTSTSTSAAAPPTAAGQERWAGRIEIPAQPALEFEVQLTPGNPPVAKIAIPAQKLALTELEDVTHGPESMTFTLAQPGTPDSARARFTIVRTPGEPIARGTLQQHGTTMQVQMRPLAAGESVGDGSRAQTPKAPFPYDEREAAYASKDGTKLAGTLGMPRSGGKHPAVLLITGTGAQDRDETLAGHKLFLVIADHLTRAGIAVLRVDDRGVGGSGGDTAKAGLDRKVEDAQAGMAWLAQQPDIDSGRIGLVGHSEGGLIAPLVASEELRASGAPAPPVVAFMVLLAGPGIPGRVLAKKQHELMMRAQGATDERLAVAMDGQSKVVDALASSDDDAALRAIIVAHTDATLRVAGEVARARLGAEGRKAMIEASFAAVANPAMRAFIRSNPGPPLEKVRCPVLALGGTLDLQVPAEENLAAIRAALDRGKNKDVTSEALPGLNHLFQPAKVGTMEEWATIDTTIDAAVLEKVAAWLRQRAAVSPKP